MEYADWYMFNGARWERDQSAREYAVILPDGDADLLLQDADNGDVVADGVDLDEVLREVGVILGPGDRVCLAPVYEVYGEDEWLSERFDLLCWDLALRRYVSDPMPGEFIVVEEGGDLAVPTSVDGVALRAPAEEESDGRPWYGPVHALKGYPAGTVLRVIDIDDLGGLSGSIFGPVEIPV